MKSKEELKELKKEYENVNRKLAELTEDELKEVTGGNFWNEDWGDGDAYPSSPVRPPHNPGGENLPGGEGGGNHWPDYYG